MYFKLINNDKIILPFVNKNSKHTFNQFTLRVRTETNLKSILSSIIFPMGLLFKTNL